MKEQHIKEHPLMNEGAGERICEALFYFFCSSLLRRMAFHLPCL